MLQGYRFDRAFLGVNGIDDQLSLLSADEYEDSIKTLCIHHSKNTYVLAGKEKFHRTAYYAVPNKTAENVMLITNYPEHHSNKWVDVLGGYIGKIGELVKND